MNTFTEQVDNYCNIYRQFYLKYYTIAVTKYNSVFTREVINVSKILRSSLNFDFPFIRQETVSPDLEKSAIPGFIYKAKTDWSDWDIVRMKEELTPRLAKNKWKEKAQDIESITYRLRCNIKDKGFYNSMSIYLIFIGKPCRIYVLLLSSDSFFFSIFPHLDELKKLWNLSDEEFIFSASNLPEAMIYRVTSNRSGFDAENYNGIRQVRWVLKVVLESTPLWPGDSGIEIIDDSTKQMLNSLLITVPKIRERSVQQQRVI